MSLLADFESSVANLKRMAGQGADHRSESRSEQSRGGGDPDRLQNAAIRAELEELRTTLSRRALEMDQRAFDLDRRRRDVEQEAEQLRKALSEQLSQAQLREKLVEKHEAEIAARLTQVTGQMQESDRSRVLAEEKFKAMELARSQAEARARELESQIAAQANGADVESKILELSNRIAQAETELAERRRKGVLDAELITVAEQKRQEAEAKSEASRQHLWAVERELGETRDRMARLTAEGVCDTQVQQAVIQAKARIAELERDVWMRQQEVDRARDERAEALKDAERASELSAKAEAVAQHTVEAVEALKNQVSTRSRELEAERAELTKQIESLQAELESARAASAGAQKEVLEHAQAAMTAQAQEAAQQRAAELASAMATEHAAALSQLQSQLSVQASDAQQSIAQASALAESERQARVKAEAELAELRQQVESLRAEWKSEQKASREAMDREVNEIQERSARQAAQDLADAREQVSRDAEARVRAELTAQFEQRLSQQLSKETAEQVRLQLAAAAEAHAAHLASELSQQRAHLQTEWRQELEMQYRTQLQAQVDKACQEQDAVRQQLEEVAQEQARSWQGKCDELVARLRGEQEARAEESRQADASQQQSARDHAELSEQLQQAHAEIASHREQADQELSQARDALQAVQAEQRKIEAAAQAAERAHQLALQAAESEFKEQLTKVSSELTAARQAQDAAQDARDQTKAKAEAQVASLREDLERTQSTSSALELQISQQQQAIAELKSSTDSGMAQAASAQEQRLAAERQVAELRLQLQEAVSQHQRDANAAAEEIRQSRTLANRTQQSAEEAEAKLQQQLSELQVELQQLRSGMAAQQAASIEQESQWKQRLQQAEIAASAQIQELTASRDAARSDVARLSSDQNAAGAEAERVIESLRRELDQVRSNHREAEHALLAVRTDSQASEQSLCNQIDELRIALAAAVAAAADSSGGSNQADAERIRFLEKQLATAAEQTGELEATVSKLAERLKLEVEQRRQIQQREGSGVWADRAQWTADRAERLRQHRRLRRQQIVQLREAGEVLRKRFEICEQVLTQRAQLAAAHQVIQETQKRQASQRAVGRAATVMGHSTIALAILAGLSWALAGQVSPGRFAARATLEADGKGRELATEELKEWQKFHEDMLNDPLFAGKVAEHMKRFAMGAMAEPGAVAERMKTDMSFESARPGVLTVELRGDGPDRTARELNAITTKLAAEAVEARARRIDGAVTIISKEAASDPNPIDSKRLQVAGAILGGCAIFGIFVATFIYRRLAAAKQKFERDIALEAILDASRWPKAGEQDEKNNAAPLRKAA